MKLNKIWMIALAVPIAFIGCDKSDVADDYSNVVKIKTQITPTSLSKAYTSEDGSGNLQDGDILGMYATTEESMLLNNSTYIIGTTVLTWGSLSKTKPVTFYAHYPQITPVANPKFYLFNVAKAFIPDLLAASATASVGEEVNLIFKHVMHRLRIFLKTDGKVPGNLSDATVTLLNMKSSVNVNLVTGVADPLSAIGTDAYTLHEWTLGSCIVAPQILTPGNDWIEIKMGGKTYTYKVPANITTLEGGKQIVLTLTLKEGGGVDGSSIGEDFTSGGGHDWI